jgi:glycine/D-amino acid oxidase-like deaminating enzyme
LLALLIDIQNERLEVGYSYGGFLTVALQRIYGIEWSPARQRAAKREAAHLRAVPRAEVGPPAAPAPLVQGGLDFPALDAAEGRDFAAGLLGHLRKAKGMK